MEICSSHLGGALRKKHHVDQGGLELSEVYLSLIPVGGGG